LEAVSLLVKDCVFEAESDLVREAVADALGDWVNEMVAECVYERVVVASVNVSVADCVHVTMKGEGVCVNEAV